jgi:SNF2 family DNA or RNA helicase
MDELQEIIKPFYLRRVTEDLKSMVEKRVKFLHYNLSTEEEISYDNIWNNYKQQLDSEEKSENSEKYKKLIEDSILRQWLADKMIPRTISLVRKCIEKNHKVIIFCAYDNEINTFRKEFEGISVYHNGKISLKKKNESVERFQKDDSVKVFIGNLQSASVGLTLTAGDVVVFNNFSFVPADNLQAENRIHRLSQTKPCTIYYQSFNGTYFDRMLDIVRGKQDVINNIIVSEKEK